MPLSHSDLPARWQRAARVLAAVAHDRAGWYWTAWTVDDRAYNAAVGEGFTGFRRHTVDAIRGGRPFPVSGEHCEHTVFPCPNDNHAFRAWHDGAHFIGRHGFDLAGEAATLKRQEEDVRRSPACLPRDLPDVLALLRVEVLGQALAANIGGFPDDQVSFTLRMLDTLGA